MQGSRAHAVAATDVAAHVARYRDLRKKLIALHHDVQKKHLSKDALTKSARRLGIPVQGRTFLFRCSEELSILMDYCLYDHRDIPYEGPARNAIERCLDRDPPLAGTDERAILEACSAARYTIIRVEAVHEGLGIEAYDLLDGRAFLLTDLGLGSSARKGAVLAVRVVAPFGIHMTTGNLLPIDASIAGTIESAVHPGVRRKTAAEIVAMSPAEKAGMSAAIIRACLTAGASEYIYMQE
jgi:hypothetical protein